MSSESAMINRGPKEN